MLFLAAASHRSRQNSCSDLELLLELTVCSTYNNDAHQKLITSASNEIRQQTPETYRDFLLGTLCLLIPLQLLVCTGFNSIWTEAQSAAAQDCASGFCAKLNRPTDIDTVPTLQEFHGKLTHCEAGQLQGAQL